MNYLFFFAGQLGLMIQARFFFQWIIDFSSKTDIGFNVAIVGALVFGFRIFDAITDPLAGTLSDHFYKKGHSRSAFLGYSACLMSLGLFCCFQPSSDYSGTVNLFLYVLGFLMFFSGYTLYCIPYWSLIDEFGGSDKGLKVRLSSLVGQGLFMATAIGFVLGPIIIAKAGYANGALISIIFGLPLMVLPKLCKFTHVDPSVLSANSQPKQESIKEALTAFWSVFKNPKFKTVLFLFAGTQIGFTILTTLSPMFVVDVLKKDISFLGYVMGPVILTAIIAFFFVPKLLKKRSAHYLAVAYSFVIGGLYMVTPVVQSHYDLTAVIVLFALLGPCLAVILGLENFLINDSSERHDKVGITFGAFNLAVKFMNGLALLFCSFVVSRLRETQDPKIILNAISIGGAIILLTTIIAMRLHASAKK